MIRSVRTAHNLLRKGWILSYSWGWRLIPPADSKYKPTPVALHVADNLKRLKDVQPKTRQNGTPSNRYWIYVK